MTNNTNGTRKKGSGVANELTKAGMKSAFHTSRPIRVLKFGGTSVADAGCIQKVVEIIRSASYESQVAVVVSAMSGVTNQLVVAVSCSEAGNFAVAEEILNELRTRHYVALNDLICAADVRARIAQKTEELFKEATRLCQGASLLCELTPRIQDAIVGIGERLSAPLIAATLSEQGISSEAIEATELVITDGCHGAAEPHLDLTRKCCQARLTMLLEKGTVPVITGFIGSTQDGVQTTLGRGGSDYSAAILGAAIDADEVVIWTDVDGILTADPRLVPEACSLREISYREAAELAFFGAKVLHPKTLCPLTRRNIPVWIRNTFDPEKAGTKITAEGRSSNREVTALATIDDASLIGISGPSLGEMPDAMGRAVTVARQVRADLFFASLSSSQNEICLVVRTGLAARMLEQLRREFSAELADQRLHCVGLDRDVAVVSVVGERLPEVPGIVHRTFRALGYAGVDTISISYGASGSSIAIAVDRKDARTALAAIHREFQLEISRAENPEQSEFAIKPASAPHPAQQCVADAD